MNFVEFTREKRKENEENKIRSSSYLQNRDLRAEFQA